MNKKLFISSGFSTLVITFLSTNTNYPKFKNSDQQLSLAKWTFKGTSHFTTNWFKKNEQSYLYTLYLIWSFYVLICFEYSLPLYSPYWRYERNWTAPSSWYVDSAPDHEGPPSQMHLPPLGVHPAEICTPFCAHLQCWLDQKHLVGSVLTGCYNIKQRFKTR